MKSEQRLLLSVKEAKAPFYFGVDVGGTNIKVGLVDDYGRSINSGEVDEDGNPRSYVSIKTEPNPQTATELVAQTIGEVLGQQKIKRELCLGIGLGIPGTMDMKTKKLRRPPNLHSWEGFPMVDALEKQSGFPTLFCNDANAAAYGEYWVGSAYRQQSMALLTLGTGIGCGIIIEGRSIDGSSGYGGECGHLVIDCSENALMCGCGQRGHLEAYASATGVARRTISLTNQRDSSIRARILPETRLSEIAKIVYLEAEKGDALAFEIVMETAKYLSLGIVSLLNTLDPSCILLGGAMTFGGPDSPLGQRFLEQVIKEVKAKSFKAIADSLLINFASLGSDAGYIGAAGLAREQFAGAQKKHSIAN